jgi:hypothetical protein
MDPDKPRTHLNLGDLIKENAAKILDRLHPSHELFEFSNG